MELKRIMHSFQKKQEASWCCFALLVNGNSGKPEIQLPRQQRQRRHQDPLVNANTTQPNKQTNKQGDKDKDEQSDESALVKKYEEKSEVQNQYLPKRKIKMSKSSPTIDININNNKKTCLKMGPPQFESICSIAKGWQWSFHLTPLWSTVVILLIQSLLSCPAVKCISNFIHSWNIELKHWSGVW